MMPPRTREPSGRAELAARFPGRVRFDEPMSRHTSFRVGGAVDVWVEPAGVDDLQWLAAWTARYEVPLAPIGGGSNLLVDDAGLPGIAVHLRGAAFRTLRVEGTRVWVGAGVRLGELLATLHRRGLSGAEGFVGIPGTVGGAVRMNTGGDSRAGRAKAIGDCVVEVRILDSGGETRVLWADQMGFGYRTSSLRECVVLEVVLEFEARPVEEVGRVMTQCLARKRETQELAVPNAGSVFKNPADTRYCSAQLIDRSGLKGAQVGGAAVSRRHANFIINVGGATSSDIWTLMRRVRDTVARDHGVWLEPEIRLMGGRARAA